MECTTSKLRTCRVTNGGPIRSAFYVVSQSKNKATQKRRRPYRLPYFCRHCRDVTSGTCHGSTISSADCLSKLNHAQKVGRYRRSSDSGSIVVSLNLSSCAAPPAISRMAEVNVTEPEVTWLKLNDLPSDTPFSFYVWATTGVGRGAVNVITERTLTVDCKFSACMRGEVLFFSSI